MNENIKKKRGRKPKNIINKIDNIINSDENKNSENENIILHLPISINNINNINNINTNLLINNDSINDSTNEKYINDSDYISSAININSNINKINIHILNFNKNTKCWWCKYNFDTEPIQLPDDYYNNTFYCIGHFCSFNCIKSYNLDLNDTLVWKRESLINLLYYKIYSKYIKIMAAPHWLSLIDFGGNLTINEFRINFHNNTKDYTLLYPPIISRQMQIEESYKVNKIKEVPIDKINKIYSEIDSEYMLKRNKNNNIHLTLESTMGIIKNKK